MDSRIDNENEKVFQLKDSNKDRKVDLFPITQWYHEPYKCDWGEARKKALERIRSME